jgi:hypothetical protein
MVDPLPENSYYTINQEDKWIQNTSNFLQMFWFQH